MATPNFTAVNELAEPALALAVSPVNTGARHRTTRRTTIHITDSEDNHEVNLWCLACIVFYCVPAG